MISRRNFLQLGAMTGVGLALGVDGTRQRVFGATRAPARPPLDPSTLAKFVDAVPVPGVLQPLAKINGSAYYEVTLKQVMQQLHRDLPPTTVWGYNGLYPGPTIEARSNVSLQVKWISELPDTHLLPVDRTLDMLSSMPDVRVVTHLHGGHVPSASDGGPLAWFTRGYAQTGPLFSGQVLTYPNRKQSCTLWYHDHAVGITRLNVYAGLAAFYIIRDTIEDNLKLPAGAYEIPLAMQDRMFNDDGSLLYPINDDANPPEHVWIPEFFGDTMLVNGKVWPFLEVEPRKYRFRLLNGCNARTLRIWLEDSGSGAAGPQFVQIGSDGGLMEAPVAIAPTDGYSKLLMAPAERCDVIIDFSAFAGQSLTMRNDAPAPFQNAFFPDDSIIPQVMEFRVTKPLAGPDTSVIPAVLTNLPKLSVKSASATRDITLQEILDADGNSLGLRLNGQPFAAPVTETPQVGSSEVWNLINLTGDMHPIHLHLVQFRIVDRTPFNADTYAADLAAGTLQPLASYFTGAAMPPDANEAGLKDTVRANPGQVTRIVAQFADFTGDYVYHCHILEHEDNDMMRPLRVIQGKKV